VSELASRIEPLHFVTYISRLIYTLYSYL